MRVEHRGRNALIAVREFQPDVVVLDIMMPDIDGLETLDRIRAIRPEIRVLFLTALDGHDDRIAGLHAGGDDYLTKPFAIAELQARVRVLARTAAAIARPDASVLRVGDIVLDKAESTAALGARPLELTPTEFELLLLLANNAGRVLRRPQILEAVWGYDFGAESNVVEVYVSSLRRKLTASTVLSLETVRLVGYVLRVGEDERRAARPGCRARRRGLMSHARSLRLQVVLIASALVAAVSIVVGVVSVVSLNDYLLGQLDTRVTGAAHRGAEIVGARLSNGRAGGTGIPGGAATPATPGSPGAGSSGRPARDDIVGAPGQSPGTVTAIFQDGRFLVGGWIEATGTRHDLTAAQQKSLAARAAAGAGDSAAPTTIDLGGSLGEYRIAARTASTGAVVVTGLPLDQVSAATGRLLLVVTLVGISCIALAILAAALAMGRALRPLRRVASTAAAVTDVPLDRGEVTLLDRVHPRDIASTAEVGLVGAALNDLLDHVEHALAQREASESTMRRFVADASHELRTPLATIRAYAQLSRRAEAEAAEIRGNAALIDDEGVRMGALIDQLLLLARLDALPEVAREDVDLRLLVAESVHAARLAGRDHTWVMELGEDPAVVRGDGADLRRVIDNLLGNARLHTPAGTTVRVRLDAVQSGPFPELVEASVRITVSDDGPGLSDAVRETVFERFARGETSRSREGGGTGLGMAIARAVVEAHGGTIVLAPGPGATFVVELPVTGPPTTTGGTDPGPATPTTLDG